MATISIHVGLIKVVVSDPTLKSEEISNVVIDLVEKTINLVKEADIPETKFNPRGPGDDIDPNGNIVARA